MNLDIISLNLFSHLKNHNSTSLIVSTHFTWSIDGHQSDLGEQGLSCSCTELYPVMKTFHCNQRIEKENKRGETELFFFKCMQLKKKKVWGFPGGTVVGSLPVNAGDTGSSPGLGGSQMPRSNKPREPQLLSLRIWSLRSATREATIVRGPRTAMNTGPRLPQLEKALAQKRRPNTAKNK